MELGVYLPYCICSAALSITAWRGGGGRGGEFNSDAVHAYTSDFFSIIILYTTERNLFSMKIRIVWN